MNDVLSALKRSSGSLPAELPPDLGPRLADRAARERLLDVAYASVDSPLGPITVASTPRGLVRVAYMPPDQVIGELAAKLSPRVLEVPARLDEVRRELDEYFAGQRHEFELEIDWSLTRGFTRRVLQATAKIDYGAVRSYAEVAAQAGSPRAVRAAGNALGGYTGGIERKQHLLGIEGSLREPLA